MRTLAQGIHASAGIGTAVTLPHCGSWLENALAYGVSAREIKALAQQRLVRIVGERTVASGNRSLITDLVFSKLG